MPVIAGEEPDGYIPFFMGKSDAERYAKFLKKKNPLGRFTVHEAPTMFCITLAHVVNQKGAKPRICTSNNFFEQFGPPGLSNDP